MSVWAILLGSVNCGDSRRSLKQILFMRDRAYVNRTDASGIVASGRKNDMAKFKTIRDTAKAPLVQPFVRTVTPSLGVKYSIAVAIFCTYPYPATV